jgi:hypothetical protein
VAGFGKRHCKELLNHTFGKTPDTTPAGVIYLSLHTADPGEDGQTSNEATGSGYARKVTAATDWNAATNADPSVTTNGVDLAFPTATGDWSSGTAFTHVGLWIHATLTTEANFLGVATLNVAKSVLNNDTMTILSGALSVTMD